MIETTEGALLGGRVRHAQPASGFRTGLEPVLLAAAVPARPGQRVIEGGSGSGAALLCLSARVPGVRGTGVEIDPGLAALARANAAANRFCDLGFEAADLLSRPAGERFQHAFANPPYHLGGTPSPAGDRERAKRTDRAALRDWVAALGRCLEPRGSLTLIIGATALDSCISALDAALFGSLALHPFWPRVGTAAKLVLVQAVRGGRGGARMLPGLALHGSGGGFTAEAEAVLRGGEALRMQPEQQPRWSDRFQVHVS